MGTSYAFEERLDDTIEALCTGRYRGHANQLSIVPHGAEYPSTVKGPASPLLESYADLRELANVIAEDVRSAEP